MTCSRSHGQWTYESVMASHQKGIPYSLVSVKADPHYSWEGATLPHHCHSTAVFGCCTLHCLTMCVVPNCVLSFATKNIWTTFSSWTCELGSGRWLQLCWHAPRSLLFSLPEHRAPLWLLLAGSNAFSPLALPVLSLEPSTSFQLLEVDILPREARL